MTFRHRHPSFRSRLLALLCLLAAPVWAATPPREIIFYAAEQLPIHPWSVFQCITYSSVRRSYLNIGAFFAALARAICSTSPPPQRVERGKPSASGRAPR